MTRKLGAKIKKPWWKPWASYKASLNPHVLRLNRLLAQLRRRERRQRMGVDDG
jgi:hypothetical protein